MVEYSAVVVNHYRAMARYTSSCAPVLLTGFGIT